MGYGKMQWKERVIVNKTKGMQVLFGKKSSVLKVKPCGVCGEWVGRNSFQCTKNVRGGFIVIVLMCLDR